MHVCIGREQYCAKFHTGELRGIAHCAATHKLVTCGDGCVKLIDMRDWRVSLVQRGGRDGRGDGRGGGGGGGEDGGKGVGG
ncbi:unnamed protein product, partial [Laminaria digitata]